VNYWYLFTEGSEERTMNLSSSALVEGITRLIVARTHELVDVEFGERNTGIGVVPWADDLRGQRCL